MARTSARQGTKSNWKKHDQKYRDQEKARRRANTARRATPQSRFDRGEITKEMFDTLQIAEILVGESV